MQRADTQEQYYIMETGSGPQISDSRVMVYDVLIAQQKGESIEGICEIWELNEEQVRTALDYIDEHRERLVAELGPILERKAERKARELAEQAELFARLEAKPMTPLREAFFALRERHRQRRAERYGNTAK